MIDAQIPQSPRFAREQRRRALWAGVGGLAMGLVVLALGIESMRTGIWVSYGREYGSLELPGWVVTLMALFILFCSAWILRRLPRKV